MAKQDEQRLLVKIATLYYLEGRKQSDIAQLLSLSQSFVSRAITRCQKEGVVKISVVQPSNIFLKLEKGLEDRYGLKQAGATVCFFLQTIAISARHKSSFSGHCQQISH